MKDVYFISLMMLFFVLGIVLAHLVHKSQPPPDVIETAQDAVNEACSGPTPYITFYKCKGAHLVFDALRGNAK